jgi:hypothetical protein
MSWRTGNDKECSADYSSLDEEELCSLVLPRALLPVETDGRILAGLDLDVRTGGPTKGLLGMGVRPLVAA